MKTKLVLLMAKRTLYFIRWMKFWWKQALKHSDTCTQPNSDDMVASALHTRAGLLAFRCIQVQCALFACPLQQPCQLRHLSASQHNWLQQAAELVSNYTVCAADR
jgi:hypothetical protein